MFHIFLGWYLIILGFILIIAALIYMINAAASYDYEFRWKDIKLYGICIAVISIILAIIFFGVYLIY